MSAMWIIRGVDHVRNTPIVAYKYRPTGSGVLLKMEVGIYAKRRGKGTKGTLLIYDR